MTTPLEHRLLRSFDLRAQPLESRASAEPRVISEFSHITWRNPPGVGRFASGMITTWISRIGCFLQS
ncbi:MAG: hypothetical protein ABR599_02515 [Gemmatimonadota bacterium]